MLQKSCDICKKYGPFCDTQRPYCFRKKWSHKPYITSSLTKKEKKRFIQRTTAQWYPRYNIVSPVEHPCWKKKRFLRNSLRQKRKPRG